MSHYAELDESGNVVRVVVCDDPAWLASRLGGTWAETKYSDTVENYAGIGYLHDSDSQAQFAPAWRSGQTYRAGDHVAHNGVIWQSRVKDNVWAPGEFGWFDALSEVPAWRQPAGAGDEWGMDDEVMHNGKQWRSKHAANVWEPGKVGSDIWLDVTVTETPTPTIPAWVQPTGAHDAYALGAKVTHNGKTWQSGYAANVWEPGVFGWTQV